MYVAASCVIWWKSRLALRSGSSSGEEGRRNSSLPADGASFRRRIRPTRESLVVLRETRYFLINTSLFTQPNIGLYCWYSSGDTDRPRHSTCEELKDRPPTSPARRRSATTWRYDHDRGMSVSLGGPLVLVWYRCSTSSSTLSRTAAGKVYNTSIRYDTIRYSNSTFNVRFRNGGQPA